MKWFHAIAMDPYHQLDSNPISLQPRGRNLAFALGCELSQPKIRLAQPRDLAVIPFAMKQLGCNLSQCLLQGDAVH